MRRFGRGRASNSPNCTSGLKSTMIYVTHDQVEAMTLADRIVVLNDCRIEQVGTPMEVYTPAGVAVRRGASLGRRR